VTTGIGAVINTAKVEIGSRAIVFGLGGIGLNVIQGCGWRRRPDRRRRPQPGKKPMAEKFGMTDFVNPNRGGGRSGALSRGPDQGRRGLHLRRTGNVR
jgi:S-(hydroxymethyl)glutathione dehydrogenase/alcohol dehydrogenase